MKRIILTFGLVLTALALFSQIPRIRLNQVQKDTLWGSVLISSPVDSNLTYSRDFYIGPDTSLNFYGTVLVAGGGGGGGSFVTTTILSDSLANYILKAAGFGGDVSGTYDNITVIDDSHNHIIGNVDGLQTALDGKLTSVNAGVGLTGSGTTGSPLLVDTSGTIVSKNFYFGNLPAGGGGTVTSVDIAAGTGISVSGSPITTSGTITVTNSAPDQTVSLTGAGINSVTGTYPNFTITGTEVDGSTTNELQTISTSGAAGNISLSNGGGTLNLNVNDADASATNEGSLSVGAGGANSSDIVSNTSGSTNVTIAGSGAVTVTESGSTITIASTGGGGSSFNNLTETADTIFVAKYLNVDTATLYVDAINNQISIGSKGVTPRRGKVQIYTDVDNNPLHITGNTTGGGTAVFQNFNDAGYSGMNAFDSDDTLRASFSYGNKNAPTLTNEFVFATRQASTHMVFYQGGQQAGNERLRFLSDSTIVFSQGETNPRMTIAQEGKVGIGTSAPSFTFHVNAPTGSDRMYLTGALNDGNELSTAIVANSREAAVGVYKPTDRNPSGFLLLESRDGDNVYLYTDSTSANNVFVSTTQTNIGTSTGGTLVGSQTSDKRIKTDLGTFPYGLNEILQLTPVQFAFKEDFTMKRNIGFYAQDVLPIIPESVYNTNEIINEGEPTKLGMQYVMIIPVLVKSIQEQQAIIESQKAEIEQLKNQYNELLQRIITLENK